MVMLIVIGIILMVLLILATLIGVAVYSGLFTTVHVGSGQPPVQSVTVAYKFGTGPYYHIGHYCTELVSVAPDNRLMCVYYDNPEEVPKDKLRWVASTILAEGFEMVNADLWTKLRDKGFRLFQFPLVSNVVKTSFPYRTTLSIFLGVWKVYPRLGQYVREKKLCAYPWIEIYDGSTIRYMGPLSKQEEFYVPEALEAEVRHGDKGKHSRPRPEVDVTPTPESELSFSGDTPLLTASRLARDSVTPLTDGESREESTAPPSQHSDFSEMNLAEDVASLSKSDDYNAGSRDEETSSGISAINTCSSVGEEGKHSMSQLPGDFKEMPMKNLERSPDLQDACITSSTSDSYTAKDISPPPSVLSEMSGQTEGSGWDGSTTASQSTLTEYSSESEGEHLGRSGRP